VFHGVSKYVYILIGMSWVLFFQDLFANMFFIDVVHTYDHHFNIYSNWKQVKGI
jgi:hypothetical protein